MKQEKTDMSPKEFAEELTKRVGEKLQLTDAMIDDAIKKFPPVEAATEQKRPYVQAPVVTDVGLPCPHCGTRYDHRTANTYSNGMRRMICGTCHKPFPARRLA